MRLQQFALPLAIAAVAATGAWVHFLLSGLSPEMPIDPEHPDYIVRDIRITEITPEGVPGRIVEATELRHYSLLRLTTAEAPLVRLFREGAEDWRVRAEAGRILHRDDEILLEGEVQIDRSATGDTAPLRILTRDLRILDEGRFAETPQPARIESGRQRVTGTGLQAWLETPVRVKLLAQVRGHHEPD